MLAKQFSFNSTIAANAQHVLGRPRQRAIAAFKMLVAILSV